MYRENYTPEPEITALRRHLERCADTALAVVIGLAMAAILFLNI